MRIRLKFRRYRLALRFPLRTAHQHWTEREGLIVRLETEHAVAYAEIAPIPAFGTESVDAAERVLTSLGESIRDADGIPPAFGCTRQALRSARDELAGTAPETPGNGDEYRAVAALLPAGKTAAAALQEKADAGFRVFKWKVGAGDPADELSLLDDLCAALPSGARLRLDANGAWDRRVAERWLERCADRPIEYVEQPVFAGPAEGVSQQRRAEDMLLGLAADYPTPIALDESVVGDGDVQRWVQSGWPGWYVIKPSLIADSRGVLQRLQAAKATVVFSSALETAVGARRALTTAFGWSGTRKALGFGVWPLFADSRFEGPLSAPFVRWSDVERLNPEAVWNALG